MLCSVPWILSCLLATGIMYHSLTHSLITHTQLDHTFRINSTVLFIPLLASKFPKFSREVPPLIPPLFLFLIFIIYLFVNILMFIWSGTGNLPFDMCGVWGGRVSMVVLIKLIRVGLRLLSFRCSRLFLLSSFSFSLFSFCFFRFWTTEEINNWYFSISSAV